jgi:membrane protease YdiL (CAAX protease family)
VNAVFLALLAVYVIYALTMNRHDESGHSRITKLAGVAMHAPLFLVSCYCAWRADVFSRQLVSPVYIAVGLVGGHLIFALSLLLTHRSFRTAFDHFTDLSALWDYIADHPDILTRFIGVAAGEEIIYRAAAQPTVIDLAGNAYVGIVLIAAAFSVVHRHFFRNPMEQSAEFAAFAIVLGVLYYWTGSLILVLAIHAVRNIEIAYLEYMIEQEEHEEDTAAAGPETMPDLQGGPEHV